MKEEEFLLNINNKEILFEILNHSIDFLIGNQDDQQTMHLSHKYGFLNPDDFLLITRSIAKFYRNVCCADIKLSQNIEFGKTELSYLTPEYKKIVSSALLARQNEVLSYLLREQNAIEYQLLESFDWDTRLILGDSSFAKNSKLVATLTLNLRCSSSQNEKQQLHVEMDYEKLNEFIKTIEHAAENLK